MSVPLDRGGFGGWSLMLTKKIHLESSILATPLMKELSQVILLSLVPRLHSGCLQIIQDLHHCHDEVRPYSVLKT